jgi:endo-1,4-beta-D-glucanase Y
MKKIVVILTTLICWAFIYKPTASAATDCGETGNGSYYSGVYRNMFKELLNKTDTEVKSKVNAAFQHFFYGSSNQKLYYEVGADMAYILDVANNDVRSEGMSYGLMICVQLDKKAEFDKLWKWTKTYMQHSSGNRDGFFRWQLNTNGGVIDENPAPDGEAYFITALFFAANRWGNGTGIYNYAAEAQSTLSKVQSKTGAGGINNLFNTNSKLITFGPNTGSYDYTDPSYNLPGFFELWGRWSTSNKTFWQQTPAASRKLIRDASHPTSGLTTDYSNFDGTPKTTSFNSSSHRFMYDAWRTIMNLGMDYQWFQADAQQPVIAERYLNFFKNQGSNYRNHYDWNGSNAGGDHSTGLVACNAVASLAVNNTALTTPFVQEFWNIGLPTGTYRYYDGVLYMLAMLNCSGDFKIWKPECPNTCATPAPVVSAATVTYDLNATATQLTATGTSLKWYTVATGGTALAAAPTPSTSATGTTVYYVGQTLNGCEGARTSVTIHVVNNYKIFKVSAPVVVDGTIDAVWNNASVLPAAATKLLSGTVTNAADLSGNFKALWDDTYLYVLSDVTDEMKISESTNAYDDDGVEVYIDINNDKATTYGANDVQYTFGWNKGTTVNVLPAGRSTTGITYAAVERTGGYIVEARIPWSTLQGSPAVGQLLGIDFMINDDDNNGARDGKLSWNAATDNAWQDPSLFGTAILQGLLPCTTPAAPAVTSTVTYCQNTTAAQLTANGTGLKWYSNNTTTTALASAPTPSTATAGTTTYFVSQTTNGCESSRAQITVTVNALPAAAITAGSATTFCSGGSVTLTASAGSSYVWKNGTTEVGTSATYSATTAGSYTVEVTNANNCKATSTVTVVTVNAAPSAPTVTSAVAYCQNTTAAQLTANGTGLKWYANNTTTTALASAPTPSTATAGTTTYFVSQTTNGCESSRAQITVTVNALPAAAITAGSATTFCSGGSVTLTASAGSSYVWKNGTTEVGTSATYSATTAGSYTVEVTNANNCKATSTATVVTVNTLPAAVITPAGSATLPAGGSVTLNANTGSGLTYKWFKGSSEVGTGASYTATSAGSYVLEVTNASGCKATSLATDVNAASNQPSVITITSPAANETISGTITITVNVSDPDGTITLVEYLAGTEVIGSSTTEPYSYNWTNPGSGTHVITVRVTDSNGGITTSAPVTITSESTATGIRGLSTITAHVYPNPSNADIYVETEVDLSNARFTAVNVLGEEVLISSYAHAGGARIDVSGLADGTYILMITEGTSVYRKKITVMK